MKAIHKLIYLTSVSILFLTNCSDELQENHEQVIEGKPTRVTLDFGVANSSRLSRATSPVKDEHKVNNLYVFIFNADGSLSKSQFFEYSDLEDKNEKDDNNDVLTSGKVTIETVSGTGKTIWAIANIANVSANAMRDITPAILDKINSLEELRTLTATLKQETIARGTVFMMSGTYEDADGNPKQIDIPIGGEVNDRIILKRVDAKITFHIHTAESVIFTPSEWKVVKASKKVYLLPHISDPITTSEDYFESSWANYEGEGDNFGKTFSFYVAENRKSPIKSIPTTINGSPLTPAEQYNYREKQIKTPIPETSDKPGQTETNGEYEYADPHSTYVILKGNITYPFNDNQEVSADVVYTIHLGYVEGANDFNTNRNTHYTYTVTINSADNIIIEVDNGTENQPGAEGEVIIANNIINLDSHYETRRVVFNQAQIDPSLTWYVKTAFSEGMPDQNGNHPKDYKWIKFLLNPKTGNSYQSIFATYPGNQPEKNYTDQEIKNLNYQITSDKLIDVDQLVTILKENKKQYLANNNNVNGTLFDAGLNIAFTAFIDENYYFQDPETGGTEDKTLWKKFVNQPERIMNILSNTRYSPDGESIKHVAVTSFRQKSIQTMYNVNAGDGLQTAWGAECEQETGKRPFWKTGTSSWNSTPSYNDPKNGRSNTLKMWESNMDWKTYVDPTTNKMQSAYDYARYNCMQRNRDLNGNGKIDPEEVRWYLAAIDQLTDLWIGENSYNAAARLFKNSSWEEDWYVSSTVPEYYYFYVFLEKNYWDNPTVLWSAEGSSIGSMKKVPGYNNSKAFNYRCIRNLGIDPTDETTIPQDFANYDRNTHIFSLEYLDEKSIRAYTQEDELPEHHERQADNLPWWFFEVNATSNTLPRGNANWVEIRDAVNSGNSPCPPGWRVPNQRELALMLSRVKNDGGWTLGNHMSRTRFSMNPTGSYRHGFSVIKNAEKLFLINDSGETGGVRCVRDRSSK